MKNKDRVVDLNNYIAYLLNHILHVLVCCVIGALILIIFCYLSKTVITLPGTKLSNDDISQSDNLFSSLSHNDQIAVSVAINDFEDYCNSYELLEDSIIEKIDSYNARRLNLTYSFVYTGDCNIPGEVQISRLDYCTRLLNFYLIGGGFASDLSEQLGVKSSHIQDCISVEAPIGTGVINVTIWGTDVYEDLEDIAKSQIEAYCNTIEDDNDICISLIYQVAANYRSPWIFENQKSWEAEQNKIKTRLDTAVSELSPDAFEYFSLVTSNSYPDFYDYLYPHNGSGINAKSSPLTIKTFAKYGAVGALLGFVIYGAYVLLLFMYSPKIFSVTDYTNTMGLRVIGNVGDSIEELSIVSTKITAICTKHNIREIALITTNEKNTEVFIDELGSKLNTNGIIVQCINGFFSDYKSLEELLKVNNCVIVEKMASSVYSKVYDEVVLCNENDINIVGLVNIE